MDLLIRIVDESGGHSDTEHSADKVVLGSANEAHIQLPLLELRHAIIESVEVTRSYSARESTKKVNSSLTKTRLVIRSIAQDGIEVNGNVVTQAVLQVGDLIDLPGATLHVEDAPPGFTGMIALRRAAGHVSNLSAQKLNLSDTVLAKRLFAWIGAGLVLLGMFILPLIFSGERAVDAPIAALFSDQVWTSGELHAAHELVTGDNCAGCHGAPFERVQNEACVACHGAVQDHVSAGFLAAVTLVDSGPDFGANANERCGTCHREHNEPTTLVSDADGDCLQCHATDGGVHRELDPLAQVDGFAKGTHPSYEYTLPRFDLQAFVGPGDTSWRYEAVGDSEISKSPETSELLFPHDLHLDPGAVTDLGSGDALTCGSCHSLSIDGEHFLPINMATHCQDCHQLDFDESDPERSLPHARLREAVFALEGMLLKKYFDPDDVGELFAYRKLPDRPSRSLGCTDAPDVCVERELKQIVAAQFEGEIGCAACHSFETQEAINIEDQYWVRPVKLPQDFVPDARFDHVAHQVLRDTETDALLLGDDACQTCHAAAGSSKATDLLMPAMDTCYQCHGDRDSSAQVALGCTSCHAYHPKSHLGRGLAVDQGFAAGQRLSVGGNNNNDQENQ